MKTSILLSTAAAVFSASCMADTISIRADDWFPINGQPDAAKPGFMIELATRIFTEAGHEVDYKLMPWERAVDSVRKGEFDCVVGAYKEDAPDFIFPNENWGIDDTGFFVKEGDSWTYSGPDSLLQRKVAVINGYAYGDTLDKLIEDNPSVFQGLGGSDALEKNVKKLEAGRADVIIESPSVMQAKLKEMGVSGIVLAGTLDEPSEIYIACSPAKDSSKQYMDLVDKGTAKLRASGELAKIMESYGLEDWK
ncbi:transporter substrate-binding domain-containing protein [Aliiglaciecola sp. CAU 1673]|uniref:substrate-binding periplasmic protein n=1 Tax=Aliiglaciecola sp. CAU 1673 TaxID=3032595 RepID=UPI0023DCC181|nr:transporter substrate-binding domain-containing protein [Aliiglaciecola sp. CAU 1673]MDF2177987.1 transporter substrate-binding domain-containing protein [Aliiglaciecola sp. CAU 1673]